MATYAINSGFFDSMNNDKVYNAQAFRDLFKVIMGGKNAISNTYTVSGLNVTFPNGIFFIVEGCYGYVAGRQVVVLGPNNTTYFYATINAENRTVALETGSSVPSGSYQLIGFTTNGSTVTSTERNWINGFTFAEADVSTAATEPTATAAGQIWAPVDARINTPANTGTATLVSRCSAGGNDSGWATVDYYTTSISGKTVYQVYYSWDLAASGRGIFPNLDQISTQAIIISVDVSAALSGSCDQELLEYKNTNDAIWTSKGAVNSANFKALLEQGIRTISVYTEGSDSWSEREVTYTQPKGTKYATFDYSANYTVTIVYSDDSTAGSVLKWSRWNGTGYTNQAVGVQYCLDGVWVPVKVLMLDNGAWKERDVRTTG